MYTIYLDHFTYDETSLDYNTPPYTVTSYVVYNPILASTNDEYAIGEAQLSLELSQAGEFMMVLPPTNHCADKIAIMRDNIRVYDDDKLLFFGRPVIIDRDLYNTRTITCEGALAWLNDIVIAPHYSETYTFADYVAYLLRAYNEWMSGRFPFHSDRVINVDPNQLLQGDSVYVEVEAYTSIMDCLTSEYADSNLIGDYYTRYDAVGKELSGASVYLVKPKDVDMNTNYPTIIFGDNLVDFTETVDSQDIAASIFPIGKDNLTIASEMPDQVVNLFDIDKIAMYGRTDRVIEYSNIESAATLKSQAQSDLAAGKLLEDAKRTVMLTAVDRTKLNEGGSRIELGDHVKFVSPFHGYSTILLVTKMELDLINPGNDQYTFGSEKTLTGQIAVSGRQSSSTSSKKANSNDFSLATDADIDALFN